MVREKAELWGYKKHPYDALVDEFEPHATTEEISTLFNSLRPSIIQLIKKIKTAPQIDNSFLLQKISHQKQMKFAVDITEAVGYNREYGRIDLSSHPFSMSLHPHDSRITTRVSPNAIMDNIGACLHEFGHSLYEMNLPPEQFGSPLCEAVSLGIHESQSRWWETRIGQNKSFWSYFFPKLQKHLKGSWDEISLDEFYRAINRVEPSFIRVESDEVTYTLHVILRFEMERALIEGALKPKDIPNAWNAKMKEYLGIVPKTDAEGCLQDIHWSMGAFGYFPTYSLGNLYASHFFSAFEKAHPLWEKKIAHGEFGFIRDWLKTEIHQHGKRYSSSELAKQVTGKPLSSEAFVKYLQNKYSEIYSL
jgi:carboxypeptidase Taq